MVVFPLPPLKFATAMICKCSEFASVRDVSSARAAIFVEIPPKI